MSKTVWQPAPYYIGRKRWLCTDGTIVGTPAVEHTPTQRRWRIAGTTESVPRYLIDEKIRLHMRQNASLGITAPLWMTVPADDDIERENHTELALDRHEVEVEVEDLDNLPVPDYRPDTFVPIYFEFKHAEFGPLVAMLWVTLHVDYSQNVTVRTLLTYRSTDPSEGHHQNHYVYSDADHWSDMTRWYHRLRPIKELEFPFGEERFASMRRGVSRFLELLTMANEYGQVSIPDQRSGAVGVFTLDFTRTNYTQEMQRSLLNTVQTAPAMERLQAHLDGIVAELNTLGIVADRNGYDATALLSGKLSELRCSLNPQEDEAVSVSGIDAAHTVTLDLARGVFIVSCAVHQDLNDVAAAWQVATFKAELNGEPDVLLQYARAFNRPREQARLARIIKQRTIQ